MRTLRLVSWNSMHCGSNSKSAEVEHAPHAALQVLDHVLVLHAQHPPGQRRIPVAHELEIGAVVAGDVLDAVGELLAVGEQLLEVAEAAGHRLAPRVDDLRIGQHQVDEADVAEVVGHLVDEERACRCGRRGCRRGSCSPRRTKSSALSSRAPAGSAGYSGSGSRPRRLAHDLLDVGQLLRTLDLRVRGEDLLEQRRAGARQADDEDRVRPWRRPSGCGAAKNSRVHTSICWRCCSRSSRAGSGSRALQRVAALVQRKDSAYSPRSSSALASAKHR